MAPDQPLLAEAPEAPPEPLTAQEPPPADAAVSVHGEPPTNETQLTRFFILDAAEIPTFKLVGDQLARSAAEAYRLWMVVHKLEEEPHSLVAVSENHFRLRRRNVEQKTVASTTEEQIVLP